MTLKQLQKEDKYAYITINKKGGKRLYCVFNENIITSNHVQHVRQLKEDKHGKRYPLSSDKQGVIRKENGLYHGIINKNEVIAISDDVETVYKRLERVVRDIDITIRHKKRSYETLEGYYNSLLPRVYRITSSNTEKHGFIIAMNSIKNNEPSHVELFYSLDDLYNRFDRLKNKNYYVHIAHLPDVDKERLGGIDALDIPAEWKDVSDLRAVIKARQKAGSHEAYIKKVKDELVKIKLINEDIFEKDAEDSYFYYKAEHEEEYHE